MSMTSCEIASSQRSASGGDFQCTAEELYNSFMEIVTNQEHKSMQSSTNEGTNINETENELSGNSNIMSSDKTHKMSADTVSNESPKIKTTGENVEHVALSAEWNDSCDDSSNCEDVKQKDGGSDAVERNDTDILNKDVVLQRKSQSDVSPSKSSALLLGIEERRSSSNNDETNNNILLGDSLTDSTSDSLKEDDDVFHEGIPFGDVPAGPLQKKQGTIESNILGGDPQETETKGAGSQETGAQRTEPQGMTPLGTGLGLNPQGTALQWTNPQQTNLQDICQQEMAPQGTGQQEMDPLCADKQGIDLQGTDLQLTNSQQTNSQGADLQGNDPQGTCLQGTNFQGNNPQGTDQTDVTQHYVNNDIEEGIRKASQVCDEINEFINLNRTSHSSDEILDNSEQDSNANGTLNDENGTSEVINGTENEKILKMPILVKVCLSDDSLPTSSSVQYDSLQHSGELDEHKTSVTDSVSSSEGSLSGDGKSTQSGVSPCGDKSPINWEILNTAFGGETDDDEGEVYEAASHSYGGFGLMLDDDDDGQQRLSVADSNRSRSVSQSSTMSECAFQQEYQKQHSTRSLDGKKDGVLYSGYLLKLGGTGIIPKNWRKRWCILRHDRCLYYYKSNKDKVPCGIVVLTNYIVSRGSEFHKKNCLKLSKGGGRTYFFCSETSTDMIRWMDALRKAANVIDEGTNFEVREEIIHNVAIPALSIKKPDCHGYLTKQGAKNRSSWKRRYCVLKNGCLYYYREMADTTALGVAKLHGYTLEEVTFPGKRKGFRALPPNLGMRTFSFFADNDYDRKRWIPCLEQSIGGTNTEPS